MRRNPNKHRQKIPYLGFSKEITYKQNCTRKKTIKKSRTENIKSFNDANYKRISMPTKRNQHVRPSSRYKPTMQKNNIKQRQVDMALYREGCRAGPAPWWRPLAGWRESTCRSLHASPTFGCRTRAEASGVPLHTRIPRHRRLAASGRGSKVAKGPRDPTGRCGDAGRSAARPVLRSGNSGLWKTRSRKIYIGKVV